MFLNWTENNRGTPVTELMTHTGSGYRAEPLRDRSLCRADVCHSYCICWEIQRLFSTKQLALELCCLGLAGGAAERSAEGVREEGCFPLSDDRDISL